MMAANRWPRRNDPRLNAPEPDPPESGNSPSSSVSALPRGFPMPPPRRPGPLDLLWHWRWELGTLAALAYLTTQIAVSLGIVPLTAAAGAGLAALSTMMCWPPARLRIMARVWCVVTPHRIRKGCVSAWIQTRDGKLPIIMSCSPAEYGERVRLWLPAGLTADDLSRASEVLAAACWVADVRVARDLRRAHRVTLEVIRHPSRLMSPPAVTLAFSSPALDDEDVVDPEQTRTWDTSLEGYGLPRVRDRLPPGVPGPGRLRPARSPGCSGSTAPARVPGFTGGVGWNRSGHWC
jgi:hypothetical protein